MELLHARFHTGILAYAVVIPGVHTITPLSIYPTVDNAWLLYLFPAVLGPDADPEGFEVNMADLENGIYMSIKRLLLLPV